MTETVRALPISFLARCGVAPRHHALVYDDFRQHQDCPESVPMTAEEFEHLEAWIDEFYDALGLDEYADVQRETTIPDPTERDCSAAWDDIPL